MDKLLLKRIQGSIYKTQGIVCIQIGNKCTTKIVTSQSVFEMIVNTSYLLSSLMILYNVTVILDESVEQEWVKWMNEEHVPDVMATDCFVSNRMLKVLDSPNEGVTYCMQYIAENTEKYERYKTEFAPALQADALQKFENKFVAFRTLMEFVNTK